MTKQELNRTLVNASSRLLTALSSGAADLPLTPYYSEYLTRIIRDAEYYVRIYRKHIELLMKDEDRALSSLIFMDYGAGCGLLSAFAVFAGFGKVYCTDIYPPAISDARQVCSYLGVEPEFFAGDMNDLIRAGIRADKIAGMDVIEHIYDLKEFFRLTKQHHPGHTMCFGTGSNPYNPVVRKRLVKVMEKLEFLGSGQSKKDRDDPRSYLQLRRNKISELLPQADSSELNKLAIATRGMDYHDIDLFLKGHMEPARCRIPANTCDPSSGNWAERLLFEDEYQHFCGSWYKLEWVSGFYNEWQGNSARKFALSVLNRIISLGVTPRFLSPYAFLCFHSRLH